MIHHLFPTLKKKEALKIFSLFISSMLLVTTFTACFNLQTSVKDKIAISAVKPVLSEEQYELAVGENMEVHAPLGLNDEQVEWSVSDEDVANIHRKEQSSLVYGLREGTTVVKAESQNGEAHYTVVVKAGDLNREDITIDAPTLTFYDSNTSVYGITWHSAGKYIYPVVQIVEGAEVSDDELSNNGMSVLAQEESFSVLTHTNDKYTDYVYKATLSDLNPSTVYTYRVGDPVANKWSDKAHITTKANSIEGFTFINITDSQETGNSYDDPIGSDTGGYSHNALKGAFAVYPQAELIIHSGDMVEWSKYEESWTHMLNTNKEFYMSTPTLMATGNHETSYRGSSHTFYKHYHIDTPQDGQSAENGFYYSFDYANVHFTIINTNDISDNSLTSRQLDWLTADLQNSNQQWKIVVMHNPLYSPAKWGSDPGRNHIALSLQNQLGQLFANNNVDVVIQGHDHVYMDTYPISGDGEILKDSQKQTLNGVDHWVNPKGVIYHMSAIAGKSTNKKVSQANMDYYRSYADSHVSSFAGFTVEGNKLTITTHYYDDGNNSEYASYGIIKP